MKSLTQTIITCLVVIASLGGLIIILGAFWDQQHTEIEPVSLQSFPNEQAETLSTSIDTVLNQTEEGQRIHVTPVSKVLHQDDITWTMHEYNMHLPSSNHLSALVYDLSEAIYAHGGELFQTYYQPQQHHATLVIGIGTFITHSIVLTWEPSTIEEPPVVQTQPAESPKAYRAAIVIDDLGASQQAVARLLKMQEDFTFSILPHLEFSTQVATRLHKQGKEILLHLPMQPQGYPVKSPGKGAIMVNMSDDDIASIIQHDLQTVPFVNGVNNHMGSLITMDTQKMQSVLQVLRRHDLFFLDSRTTAETVAYKLAQQIGLASAQRKVFLDVIPQVDFVKNQLRELAALAEQGKPAIAIGHPKEATFQGLEQMMPEFKRRNIAIIRVSQFIH